ncbi:MAG: VCBS repeat-containing protein [Chloroflexaceae bacterium]|nr:VCBS repeat-containing protein [Chloroflexaceae bacterium]
MDANGYLDILTGYATNIQQLLFFNQGADAFQRTRAVGTANASASVAFGDMDGDGDLDIVSGLLGSQNQLYRNTGTGTMVGASFFGTGTDTTSSIAVGDLNNDGSLDIVAGDLDQSQVYFNSATTLPTFPTMATVGPADANTVAVALGDLDNDGSLDIVAGNGRITPAPDALYLNDGSGQFSTETLLNPSASDVTRDIAVGDIDSDGDLDIVVGNRQQDWLYLNAGDGTFPTARTVGSATNDTRSIALGDMDGDGDLDIVAASFQQSRVWFNNGNGIFDTSGAFGVSGTSTTSIAVGDIDNDGDLDIIAANGFVEGEQDIIHLNDGSGVFDTMYPFGTTVVAAYAVAVGDIDNDGDLDVLVSNGYPSSPETNRVFFNGRNAGPLLPNAPPRVTVQRPGAVPAAPFFSTPERFAPTQQVLAVPYTLFDTEGDPARMIRAFFSLDGGDNWQPALPTNDTPLTNLATLANGDPVAHTFTWDLFRSGFYGQSDNVVFRIEVYPALTASSLLPDSMQRPYAAAESMPFRVRGTQVQVTDSAGTPVAAALVYRLPATQGTGALPFARSDGTAYRTDGQGFLQGRSVVTVQDRLIALLPISATNTYTLYHTSAAPTAAGVEADVVTEAAVQQLRVQATNPLILFNLTISLEWDARNDQQYLARLTNDLHRTAATLYDWTDGQATLGDVTIYYERENWNDADIRIYASNRLRPNANIGGILPDVREEPTLGLSYGPGQVRMGAIWNRYGDAENVLGEDWPRTLAHELGHYALFLDDNYLGLDPESGLLISVETCPGGMSNPYLDNNSEFRPQTDWLPGCNQTLSQQTRQRADWETITRFYPALQAPATFNTNPGPVVLPLAVTQIRFIEPDIAATTLETPLFVLTNEAGVSTVPGRNARAFLFVRGDVYLRDLGRTVGDQVEARGARVGDRLCVQDTDLQQYGCEVLTTNDQQLTLRPVPTFWQPDITITPVTSRTVALAVANLPADLTLRAQLFPISANATEPVTMNVSAGRYTAEMTLDEPAFEGYVSISTEVDGATLWAVSDYAIGGNPGGRGSKGQAPHGNPGGRGSKGQAPVISGDGQAILYGSDLDFVEGAFYTLQTVAVTNPLPWATVVGPAYRLTATANAPELVGQSSLNIGYLSSAVVPGEEQWIKVYYYDTATTRCAPQPAPCWRPLPTILNQDFNQAAAPIQGVGTYALMSSIDLPLTQVGWNLMAYPATTRPITDALRSIVGSYAAVYSYRADLPDSTDVWQRSIVDAPAYVNNLTALEFGRGYWISATETITWSIRGTNVAIAPTTAASLVQHSAPLPPATFYGAVEIGGVGAGVPVHARIGGVQCGAGVTERIAGQVVYVVDVVSAQQRAGCGTPGATVVLEVGTTPTATVRWQGSGAQAVDLLPGTASPVLNYLPRVSR